MAHQSASPGTARSASRCSVRWRSSDDVRSAVASSRNESRSQSLPCHEEMGALEGERRLPGERELERSSLRGKLLFGGEREDETAERPVLADER
jgi:hypothetical protein